MKNETRKDKQNKTRNEWTTAGVVDKTEQL